jgi:hypothetical protein
MRCFRRIGEEMRQKWEERFGYRLEEQMGKDDWGDRL